MLSAGAQYGFGATALNCCKWPKGTGGTDYWGAQQEGLYPF